MAHRLMLIIMTGVWVTPRLAAQPAETISLSVMPAAARSALPYRLTADPRELKAGNAATLYQRCLALLFENPTLAKEMKSDQWSRWLQAPVDQWPRDEVGGKLSMARWLIREAEYAAEYRDCDWQFDRRPEGIGLIIPDIQGFRSLGSILAVKARHQAALGDIDGAINSIRTGLALARHVGRGPTLIQSLVGVAIAQMMFGQIDVLIQQHGSPNLYWELTALPVPFIDLRIGLRDEVDFIERMIPALHRLDARPMSDEEVKAVQEQLARMHKELALRDPDANETALREAMMTKLAREARKNLVGRGVKASAVEKMPAFQLVVLDILQQYREVHAELYRWFAVPHFHRHPGYAITAKRHDEVAARFDFLFFR
jgi:hypothetical protein